MSIIKYGALWNRIVRTSSTERVALGIESSHLIISDIILYYPRQLPIVAESVILNLRKEFIRYNRSICKPRDLTLSNITAFVSETMAICWAATRVLLERKIKV